MRGTTPGIRQQAIHRTAYEQADKLSCHDKRLFSSIEEACHAFAAHRINLSARDGRIARFNLRSRA
ncbi:hypothetical protein EMIT0158MI4_80186 [Burkholderia ambifaria]